MGRKPTFQARVHPSSAAPIGMSIMQVFAWDCIEHQPLTSHWHRLLKSRTYARDALTYYGAFQHVV